MDEFVPDSDGKAGEERGNVDVGCMFAWNKRNDAAARQVADRADDAV